MAHRRLVHRRNPSVDQPKYAPQRASPPTSDGQLPTQPTATAMAAAQISDYESDNQAYLSEHAPQLPPPTRTNQELNLSVLQKHDPEVTAIMSIAPYAVIYEFSPVPEPAWAKTGIEGSLFICQLTPGALGEDRYKATVLNRRGLDNFGAPLIEEEDAGVEITDEYVIISFKQGSEQKIYGVFIFSEGPGSSTADTREVNANLMKTLATLATTSRRTAERDAAEALALAQAQAAQAAHAYSNGYLQETHLGGSAAGKSQGQHISLQQLFGQQRAQDASFTVRTHNLDGSVDASGAPVFHQNNYNFHPTQQLQQQPDVIGDLFRKAGIGMG